jgi:hypothetical protein
VALLGLLWGVVSAVLTFSAPGASGTGDLAAALSPGAGLSLAAFAVLVNGLMLFGAFQMRLER